MVRDGRRTGEDSGLGGKEAISGGRVFFAGSVGRFLLALLAMVIVCLRVFGDFGEDWRPSHFDEWRSLALAQRTVDSGVLAPEEPVGSPNGLARDIRDRNRSLGFVALVAYWLELAPQPIEGFKALAMAFLLLYAAGVYNLSRALGFRPWAALLAMLSLGSLPTDSMLLGPGLAVPSSLSLGVLAMGLLAHLRLVLPSAKDRRAARVSWGLVLLGVCTLLATVYPLTLIFLGALVSVDLALRPGPRNVPYLLSAVVLGALGSVLFLIAEWQGGILATVTHLEGLFWLDQRWHLVSLIVYTVDGLVAIPVLVLAFAGAALALTQRSSFWLAAAFLGPLLALAGYHFWGVGLVIPYQRVGLFLAFGAALCTGFAVDRMLAVLEGRWGPRSWAAGMLVAVAGLVLALAPRPEPPFWRLARVERPSPALEAIAIHIKHAHGPPERVHAPPREAMFLEALTGLRAPVAALDALLTGSPPPELDCDAGWEVVVGDLSCPGYTKVFESGGVPVLRLASPGIHEGR